MQQSNIFKIEFEKFNIERKNIFVNNSLLLKKFFLKNLRITQRVFKNFKIQ